MKSDPAPAPRTWSARVLDAVEWAGNRLPDPVALFVLALFATWVASALLAPIEFSAIDPRSLAPGQQPTPIRVHNQLTGAALVHFVTRMVHNFMTFPPLGVVLVAWLGVGVAEHVGFIHAGARGLLSVTPARWLTPIAIVAALASRLAGDSAYVLMIPLGGALFAATGRHPLAGMATMFFGVVAGINGNFLPTIIDPLVQAFTQEGARILAPEIRVNPLCNWGYTSVSSVLVVGLGWYLTDRVVEPRLQKAAAPGPATELPPLLPAERRGLLAALAVLAAAGAGLAIWAVLPGSPWQAPSGSLASADAPLMESLAPLLFLFFVLAGIVYGLVAGTVRHTHDLVAGMNHAVGAIGSFLVMAFFAAQFTYAFRESNVGILLAVEGAELLNALGVSSVVVILGVIALSALGNVLVTSSSAEWALLAPVVVPMLMAHGISPELTQAAYRTGGSSLNAITPLLPYYPLIVAAARRFDPAAGIGTMMSLMLPYALALLLGRTLLLILYWQLGLPLGLDAGYTYP